jgi:hypothetical protein
MPTGAGFHPMASDPLMAQDAASIMTKTKKLEGQIE